MNNKKIALGIVVGTLLVAPFATSALSIADLQEQIKELLGRLSTLQVELKTQMQGDERTTENDITVTAIPRVCKIISDRTLTMGARNDDVRGLQEFLQGEGLLSAEATGYFGTATRDALRKWQLDNSVVANADMRLGWGIAGPRTREAIMRRCGNAGALSVSPQNGAAPLTVVFTSKMGDEGPTRPSYVDGQDTIIDFGDGSERQWVQCDVAGSAMSGTCTTPAAYKHTYETNGTYTAQLLRTGGMCLGTCPISVLGTVTVRVGEKLVGCTKEYKPVCGMKPIVCITTPCNPVPQTYSNRCMMQADGATFAYEGACRDTPYNPEEDRTCKAWNDGCNSCSRSAPGQPAMCTLRACSPESRQNPSCTAHFDGTSGTRPPVISQLSGPMRLNIDETGTWSIRASDPENGQLTYSIVWGDEWYANDTAARLSPPSYSIIQSTTFTHAYARAGTYRVHVSVKDSAGKTAESSTTVTVGTTSYCTEEYAPVCGQPPEPACRRSIPACMMATPGPTTYSNTCMLRSAGAEYLYAGACTN